jgi:hypothetical protein
MAEAMAGALERLAPVEFLFGIDRDDKARAKPRREAHMGLGGGGWQLRRA